MFSSLGNPATTATPCGFTFGTPKTISINNATVKKEEADSKKADENKPVSILLTAAPSVSSQSSVPQLTSVFSNMLATAWRNITWTHDDREELIEKVTSYSPVHKSASAARVLLLGPVGAGKSSFISSVQSVFSGRVLNRAMVGSSASISFTKKFQSFNIKLSTEEANASTSLVLCDVLGFGDGDMTGLSLYDAMTIIKGHVPEGHQFIPDQPVTSDIKGFIKKPSLDEKIHCVVFVVDATKLNTYPKALSTTFQKLRERISNLGVHQVALLTHVDMVCKEVEQNITQVYRSKIVRDMMVRAGELLGMATSYIVPVKNYSSQLELDQDTDILLLSAVDHILQYADLYFQDGVQSDEDD